MVTFSKEDYLKEIYNLGRETEKRISTSFLAEKLMVSNAATSEMAKKLDDQGYVNYMRYKGIKLTPRGEKLALRTIRRHRLWEAFLIETLDLSWSEVHDEAEMLEHLSSDNLIDRIEKYLGSPEFDPHGDPIPNKNGIMPVVPDLMSLVDTEVGCEYIIARVKHNDKDLLDYFTDLGLELNKELKISNRLKFDNSIDIILNNNQHTFSEKVASKIFVVKKEKGTDGQ